MRSAGCAINDFADRNLDPLVERTRDRPLAAGRLRPPEALILFAVLSLIAFLLVLQLNRLTVAMSIVAIFLAATYPFLKRYTHLPQFYLGAAFGWSIPMAFAAHTGTVPLLAWVAFLANVFWAVAYDTAYSMVDRDDDIRIGVRRERHGNRPAERGTEIELGQVRVALEKRIGRREKDGND